MNDLLSLLSPCWPQSANVDASCWVAVPQATISDKSSTNVFDLRKNDIEMNSGCVFDVPGDAYRRWLPVLRVTVSVRQIQVAEAVCCNLYDPDDGVVRMILKCKGFFGQRTIDPCVQAAIRLRHAALGGFPLLQVSKALSTPQLVQSTVVMWVLNGICLVCSSSQEIAGCSRRIEPRWRRAATVCTRAGAEADCGDRATDL
jgi:hypothetical protein